MLDEYCDQRVVPVDTRRPGLGEGHGNQHAGREPGEGVVQRQERPEGPIIVVAT